MKKGKAIEHYNDDIYVYFSYNNKYMNIRIDTGSEILHFHFSAFHWRFSGYKSLLL